MSLFSLPIRAQIGVKINIIHNNPRFCGITAFKLFADELEQKYILKVRIQQESKVLIDFYRLKL